jgi:hypothetical protein
VTKQRRDEFAEKVKRASFVTLGLSVFLIGFAYYEFFYGGWNNPVFAIEYPIALAFVVAGLALYVGYQFDRNIHEHLDELHSNIKESSTSSISFQEPMVVEQTLPNQGNAIPLHQDSMGGTGEQAPLMSSVAVSGGSYFAQATSPPVESTLDVGKLDDAFLFVLSIATLAFTIIQTSVRGVSGLVTAIPFLLSGVALPFYVGFYRGAVLPHLGVERVRGWTTLVMGNFAMLSLLSTDYSKQSWPLYAISLFGIAVSFALGWRLARAYSLSLGRRTRLVLAGGAGSGFFFSIVAYLAVNLVSTAITVPEYQLLALYVVFSYLVLVFGSIFISVERTCEAMISAPPETVQGGGTSNLLDIVSSPLDFVSVLTGPILHSKRTFIPWFASFFVLTAAGYSINLKLGSAWLLLLSVVADILVIVAITNYFTISRDHLVR